ncbi:hypothetical protein [Paludibacterium purpuratum]|uniref:Uncharacterized protein n=1 Tax=Paludibacterium purpuratum TaxID=1144873 RepID=A0A4R7BEF8_9NEIS|nr:hypothetical protein [Paludibacterium purpuratum]TDR82146.1 hypothetical protein DFP86_102260 [Paludibacterium purpuratum]
MAYPDLQLLQNNRSEFCRIVSNHIQYQLPQSEWERLLALAQSAPPYSPELSFTAFDAIEARVHHLTFIEQISPLEMQSVPEYSQRLQTIGLLDGQPVCYYRGSGIYQWSIAPDADSLCFWLTHPAYPPDWPADDSERAYSKASYGRCLFKPSDFI